MRYKALRNHLKPYSIVRARRTTINHAFAAAIAPSDTYDERKAREAVILLGQDPDLDLRCVYCDAQAETWDHVFATTRKTEFSGHGNRLGNLLPCCKPCNSRKGNKSWEKYLNLLDISRETHASKVETIRTYLKHYSVTDNVPSESTEYISLQNLKREVLALLAQADQLAGVIRDVMASRRIEPSQ